MKKMFNKKVNEVLSSYRLWLNEDKKKFKKYDMIAAIIVILQYIGEKAKPWQIFVQQNKTKKNHCLVIIKWRMTK